MTEDLLTALAEVIGVHPDQLPPPKPYTPEQEALMDAAAERAANRRDEVWLDGQAADRLHDRYMRGAA